MPVALFISFLLILSLTTHAQLTQQQKEKYLHHTRKNVQDTAAGYAYAVKSDNILYVSGFVGSGNIAEQLQMIYNRFETVLSSFGASYRNIIKETGYAMEIDSIKTNNHVRKMFYKDDFPACTWVQVSRLWSTAADRAQVEIEIIAYIPPAAKKRKRA